MAADFVVDSPNDGIDIQPGDGICKTAQDNCTLSAAIQEANSLAGSDRIFFSLPPNSIIALAESGANGSAIVISGDLQIIGPGADLLTVSRGAGSGRIFMFGTFSTVGQGTVFISCVTIGGGNGLTLNTTEPRSGVC